MPISLRRLSPVDSSQLWRTRHCETPYRKFAWQDFEPGRRDGTGSALFGIWFSYSGSSPAEAIAELGSY